MNLKKLVSGIEAKIASGEIEVREPVTVAHTPDEALKLAIDMVQAEIEALKEENEALRRKINKEN